MVKNQVVLSGTIAAALSLVANSSTATIEESAILVDATDHTMPSICFNLNKVKVSEFGIVEHTSNVFDYDAFDKLLSHSEEENVALLNNCTCNGDC